MKALIMLVSALVIGISSLVAQTTPVAPVVYPGAKVIVIDYQDFGQIVKKAVEKTKMNAAARQDGMDALKEAHPNLDLSVFQSHLDEVTSPEVKYKMITDALIKSNKTLLTADWNGTSVPTPPNIKERADILIIGVDGKLQGCFIETYEAAQGLITITNRLEPLPDFDSVNAFIKASYDLN